MNIVESNFDEKLEGERYRGKMYDYFEGAGGDGFRARQYEDSPEDVWFLCRYHLARKDQEPFSSIPYGDEFFRSVVRHLTSLEGRLTLFALNESGYAPVDLAKIKDA